MDSPNQEAVDSPNIDEVYNRSQSSSSDLSSDEETVAVVDLESGLGELLNHVEDCLELRDEEGASEELKKVPRVEVDPQFATEVLDTLVTGGKLEFLAKYVLNKSESCPPTDLLAAIGFPLPLSVANDPKYSLQDFHMALQVAIKYTLTHRSRLSSPRTLDEVAEAISKAKNIVVITGAGISTSLGIPDFRSDDGLYAQLRHLGLVDPQEVFDIRLFREDPGIFYSIAHNLLPRKGLHSGTPTHQFIKMLNDRGKLLRNYTQNIDNIEQFVGIPKDKVVQCHGSIGSAHCITCDYKVEKGESLFPQIQKSEIPRCPECLTRKKKGKRKAPRNTSLGVEIDEDEEDLPCFGVLKPDITFFGESLPDRFGDMLFDAGDAKNCDLIICMGTSLRVSPVSEVVKLVKREVPQIYISKTPAKGTTFEVSFLGGCDDVVQLLCSKLHWEMKHWMADRPEEMSDNEYPKGTIKENNGVFTFEENT